MAQKDVSVSVKTVLDAFCKVTKVVLNVSECANWQHLGFLLKRIILLY